DVAPVPAPADVADDATNTGNFDHQVENVAMRRHILDGHRSIAPQLCLHATDRRIERRRTWFEPPQMLKRADGADEAMPAHAEVGAIVEEDDAGGCAVGHRWREQRADDRGVTARLTD